jgi:predicted ester cyclase
VDTRALVQRYYDEVWEKGNVEVIDEILTPDHVDETPPPGFDGSRETQKQIATMMRDTQRDKVVKVLDLVVEGDRVAGVWSMSWTQIGDLWGMVPADGKHIELHGIDWFELRDGKIARTRHVESWIDVLMQLGVTLTT